MNLSNFKTVRIAVFIAGISSLPKLAFAQDPASIYASAGQVKEIAEKAKAFL